MNENNFIKENQLTNLQDEFKNIKQLQENSNSELNVSVDKINSSEELINKLKIYVNEKKPSLAILTPCYGGLCYSNYTISLINTIKMLESFNSIGLKNVNFVTAKFVTFSPTNIYVIAVSASDNLRVTYEIDKL